MSWKMIRRFLRNFVITVIATMAVLGLIGFLLGGQEGLINMVIWGFFLGLMGGVIGGGGMLMAELQQNIGQGYSRWQADEDERKHKQ